MVSKRFSRPALKALLLAFSLLAVLPPGEASAWWNNQWRSRKKLFFKNLNQGQLDDFPVLVVLNSSRIDFSRTKNAGEDIRFVDADDTTSVPYEIEGSWDEIGNEYVWVRVPTVNGHTTADFIYMYYDNPNAVDAQNPSGVWNPSGYTLVYHMDEQSGDHQDSTSPQENTYDVNVANQGGAAGQMNGADEFTGWPNHTLTADDPDLEAAAGESLTIEAWVKPNSSPPAWQVVLSKEVDFSNPSDPSTEREYQLWLSGWQPIFWVHQGNNIDQPGYSAQAWGSNIDANQHYLVGTWNGATSTVELYVDGVWRDDGTNTNVTAIDSAGDFTIGVEGDSDGGGDFEGVIDEVRVSKVVRSADWIKAQHLSMIDDFITFGPEIIRCCALDTAIVDPGTDYELRVTGSSGFELHFDKRRGGGITQFFDLDEDAAKSYDLAGGDDDYPVLFYDSVQDPGDPDGDGDFGWWYWTAGHPQAALPADPPLEGNTWDVLEATTTRVKVRQSSLFQKSCGEAGCPGVAGKVFSAMTAQGDYSIYPVGRLGLRWDRKTTQLVNFGNHDMDWVVHYDLAAPLNGWTAYSQTSGLLNPPPGPPPQNWGPGGDDFLLIKSDAAGARTDFLPLLANDWSEVVVPGHTWWWQTEAWGDTPQNAGSAAWGNDTGSTANYSGTTVDFLTYFKPTNFVDHNDDAVKYRRDDLRSPASLSVSPGKGTPWDDLLAEKTNSGAGDYFNESEGVYALNIDPAAGLVVDISGLPTAPRYAPFFKIRQWRSVNDPTVVIHEGTQLKNDQDYVADVKPVSRAYHARNLLYHSTLRSAASITAPDVGNPGTASAAGYPAARFGNGASMTANTQFVGFNLADFDKTQGAVEFWFKPTYDSYDGVYHDIAGFVRDGSNMFLLEKRGTAYNDASNTLAFKIVAGGTTSEIVIPTGAPTPKQNPFWRANNWVHLRIEWDHNQPGAQQQALYLNGRRLTPSGVPNDYIAANLLLPASPNDYFLFGNTDGDGNFSAGVYDEVNSYGGLAESGTTPKPLANGGLTSPATNEYLNSGANNRALDFTAIDPQSRGTYLYFGADSKVRGLNFTFAPVGVAGGTAPVLQWEYWNGTTETWATVGSLTDGTNAFTKNGTVYWTADPGNWAVYSVNGSPDLYFVRAKLVSGGWSTPATESIVRTDILLLQYCGDITAAGTTISIATEAATAVGLQSFSARALDGAVDLEWATASEMDNLGFHLYRSTTERGPYERLTASLVPGLGSSPEGATYSYRDVGVQNGVRYFYKLEDVDTSGVTKMHGPVSAVPAAGATGDGGGGPGGGGGDPGGPGGGSGDSGGSGPDEGGEDARQAYGDPAAVSVREIQRTAGSVVVELETGGFYATPLADGSYRIEVPGFDALLSPGQPGVPLKRVFVDAVAGLGVSLGRTTMSDVTAYPGLRPKAADAPVMLAGVDGTARAGWAAVAAGDWGRGLSPLRASRLVEVGFQRETKKALLELAPLRWDASSGRLLLARKLRVQVFFAGHEAQEVVASESLGRRSVERTAPPVRRTLAYLVVRERGLQAVRFEDLGRNGRAVPVSALRLAHLGSPVPAHVEPEASSFGPGSVLYFWSEGPSLNPYATETTYELRVATEGGASMPVTDARPGGPTPLFGVTTARFETNRLYQAALMEAGTSDLWFWDSVIAPARKPFRFTLGPVAPGEASWLRVWLQGGTNQAASPDHHLVAYVNDVWAGEARWDGKRAHVLVGQLPDGVLREGENTLELHNVGDTEATVSSFYLDRFEVTFPRPLAAGPGETEVEVAFAAPGRAAIWGLSAASAVLDTTDATPRWLGGVARMAAGVSFAVEGGRRYVAVPPEGLRYPTVRPPTPSRLKTPDNRADYLVIGPRDFLEAVQPLVDLRRGEGLVVRTVATEELADEFGFGENRPEAVRGLVEYAYQHWRRPSVRYVLLVGDATYDPKNHLGAGTVNHVPPYMLRTTYLWTVSDPAVGAVNGEDLLPDLAVGRLPAASAEEARAMAEKIVAWERAGNSFGGPAVLVADNPDHGGDYEGDSEELAARYLPGRPVERIYLAGLGAGTRDAIRSAFDRGAGLVSYAGHGGILIWATENVFNNTDVAALAPQGQQPFAMMMNCLNGYFLFPPFNSLGEDLLKAPDKGAIAVFAPSGLSLNGPAHLYQQALLSELATGRHARLGDALLEAQAAYTDAGGNPELLDIFQLLGDPALTLR